MNLMPTYSYRCKKCEKLFDVVMTISEHDRKKSSCPSCKSTAVEQMITSFNVKTAKKS